MFRSLMMGGGGAAVVLDPATVFLSHYDGTDGSQSFIDERGKTITPNGGAALSTARSRFGSASLLGGSPKYLSLASSTDFNFGTGNFTIEGWVYLTSQNRVACIFASAVASFSAGARTFYIGTNGDLSYVDYNINAGGTTITGANGSVPLNAWTHVALVRNGTGLATYAGGVLKGSATISASQAIDFSAGGGSRIAGGTWDGADGYLNGNLDEQRVRKGVAVYTGAFTPPSAPFSS